jgi:hypothetical protein
VLQQQAGYSNLTTGKNHTNFPLIAQEGLQNFLGQPSGAGNMDK